MRFLVDADVLSEPTKVRPEPRVLDWLRKNEADLVVNPIVLGEIEFGILLLPSGKKRTRLYEWFEQGIARMRAVDLDARTASAWAHLVADLRRAGRAMQVKDSLIAASARAHGLTVATRNIAHFRFAGVPLVNPFTR